MLIRPKTSQRHAKAKNLFPALKCTKTDTALIEAKNPTTGSTSKKQTQHSMQIMPHLISYNHSNFAFLRNPLRSWPTLTRRASTTATDDEERRSIDSVSVGGGPVSRPLVEVLILQIHYRANVGVFFFRCYVHTYANYSTARLPSLRPEHVQRNMVLFDFTFFVLFCGTLLFPVVPLHSLHSWTQLEKLGRLGKSHFVMSAFI